MRIGFACGLESPEKLLFIASVMPKMHGADSRDALVSWVSLAAVCVNVCLINWNKLIRGQSPGATPKDTPKGIVSAVATQRFACCPLH